MRGEAAGLRFRRYTSIATPLVRSPRPPDSSRWDADMDKRTARAFSDSDLEWPPRSTDSVAAVDRQGTSSRAPWELGREAPIPTGGAAGRPPPARRTGPAVTSWLRIRPATLWTV